MPQKRERSCFIIGPMRDAHLKQNARLVRLAREVIEPLLREIEAQDGERYVVRTPYDLGGGNIMNDVIYAIDRADLVVADLTDSNPNAFYELGITHALGRACVSVMEETQQKIEFDLSAYRVYKINLDEERYSEAQNILRDALRTAHRSISDWSKLENPVIDFFRAPITYISPAFSLAQGYYLNFVRPVVESLIKRKGQRYLYDVGVSTDDSVPTPNKIDDTALLPDDVRAALELHIVIPNRIGLTKHGYTDRLRGVIPAAVVEGDGRHYTCFYHSASSQHTLIDIPTTLRVLEDAVERRMRYPNVAHEAPEWREIEEQELDHVAVILQSFIARHPENPAFARRVRILRYDPDTPGDLLWLRDAGLG